MKTPQHNYVAIITARGGSVRFKNKNLYTLAGKPLITHTLDAAIQSQRFAAVVVTSDAHDILEVAKTAGAKTIKRPSELADNFASSEDTIRHALDVISSDSAILAVTDFVLLQPTSPLRTAHHIAEAIDLYEREHFTSLASVVACDHPPQKSLTRTEDGMIEPLTSWEDLSRPRQRLADAFQTNGAIYISDVLSFIKKGSLFSPPFGIYEMTRNESVDIDTPHDMAVAEATLNELKS